jgi:hypothetical protein
MNCHGNNQDNKNNGHKGHMSHMFMMILCCGAPILILSLLPILRGFGLSSGAGSVLTGLSTLICPIMMFGMMFMMMKGQKGGDKKENCCSGEKPLEQNKRIQE